MMLCNGRFHTDSCCILLLVLIATLLLDQTNALRFGSHRSNRASSALSAVLQSSEYLALKGVQIQSVAAGTLTDCDVLLKSKSNGPTLVVALTHYGDFNSWEMTQQLKYNMKRFRSASCRVIAIGIGERPQALEFAKSLDLPSDLELYTDANGKVQEALGCSKGFAPNSVIPPWVRVFAMLTGIGSPGTIPQALLGYIGSNNYKRGRNWVVKSLLEGSAQGRFPSLEESAFQGDKSLKDDGQDGVLNPFELATLRLQTGSHIVSNWKDLRPNNSELFTRQGGSFLFSKDGVLLYEFKDPGILNYADPVDILKILENKKK